MSFNGSGLFQINTSGQPVVSGTAIDPTVFNALTADLATGLTTCITKDGQTTPTANIPMGSNKITGLAAGTASTDAANIGNLQSGTGVYVGTVGGTADVITLTASPAIAAYAAGQRFYFIASGANTTNVTVNVNSLGAKALTKNGTTALVADDIPSGMMVTITYDGTRFILGTVGSKTFLPLSGGTLTGDTTIAVSDARTNAVDVPLTLTSVTSDTPAAGIGTGLLFKAESADENPSDFGQLEVAAADVGSGTEDTYFQMLTRVAGAALTATYRFIATAANKAIFTHANSADRTYTFPNASGNIPTLATQGETDAMTSTATALSPNVNKLILATEQASTSGTSIDFTNIPAGVRRISITFVGVSTNGTSPVSVQLGDAGGFETTNYLGSTATANHTNSFRTDDINNAAGVRHGRCVLELEDASDFTWSFTALIGRSDSTGIVPSAGTKALSAELTQVRITTVGGTDAFDAGAINILCER